MLVLSRGQNEKIVFPRLGVSVEVLKIARNKVRIGVNAPAEVSVLRDELAPREVAEDFAPSFAGSRPKLSHELRNRLHTAQLALQLSQRLLSIDRQEEAEEILQRALTEFEAVEQRLNEEFPSGKTPRRALVVEDNANEGELLAAYLRACGYQADTARDGYDAMNKLESLERPDVILLDMMMPRCDGLSMLRSLGADSRFDDLTVFAVTGSEPDRFQAARGGRRVDAWFQKPVDPEHLVREINRVLSLARTSVN